MPNLSWNAVRADFSDANALFKSSNDTISQAGNVFGAIAKQLQLERQMEIENEKEKQKLQLEYQKNSAKQFMDILNYSETVRHHDNQATYWNNHATHWSNQDKLNQDKLAETKRGHNLAYLAQIANADARAKAGEGVALERKLRIADLLDKQDQLDKINQANAILNDLQNGSNHINSMINDYRSQIDQIELQKQELAKQNWMENRSGHLVKRNLPPEENKRITKQIDDLEKQRQNLTAQLNKWVSLQDNYTNSKGTGSAIDNDYFRRYLYRQFGVRPENDPKLSYTDQEIIKNEITRRNKRLDQDLDATKALRNVFVTALGHLNKNNVNLEHIQAFTNFYDMLSQNNPKAAISLGNMLADSSSQNYTPNNVLLYSAFKKVFGSDITDKIFTKDGKGIASTETLKQAIKGEGPLAPVLGVYNKFPEFKF